MLSGLRTPLANRAGSTANPSIGLDPSPAANYPLGTCLTVRARSARRLQHAVVSGASATFAEPRGLHFSSPTDSRTRKIADRPLDKYQRRSTAHDPDRSASVQFTASPGGTS
jgi:hypothetical protein